MTIEQAIKVGLPLKRPNDKGWRDPKTKLILSPEDILASDWITQPQDLIVNLESLRSAWEKSGLDKLIPLMAFENFARALGVPGYEKPEPQVVGRGIGALIPGACL